MKMTAVKDEWTLVPLPGDKQVVNQGFARARVAQSDAKPTNLHDGELLSTYAENYAVVFVGGMQNTWVLGVGNDTLLSIEGV